MSDAASQPENSTGRIPFFVVLVVMIAALAFAVLILSRVAGPLYGLLFPVEPPVPDGAQLVEHVDRDHEPEYWLYRTAQPGREVAAFYEAEGGNCQYSPLAGSLGRPDGQSYNVATCQGSRTQGGLTTSWDVYIAEGYTVAEGPTIFRLYKYGEVN